MQYKLFVIFLFIGLTSSLKGQETMKKDSIEYDKKGLFGPIINYAEKTIFQYLQKSSQAPSKKAFNFSVIGGPYYTHETKIGLGVIGSGLFRLRGCENDLTPSNVSLYTNVTTSGAYAIGIRSELNFPHKEYWINADISFSDTPSQFWGVGYSSGNNSEYTEYNLQQIQLSVDFYKKLSHYSSVGIVTNNQEIKGKHIDDLSFFDNRKIKNTVFGAGLKYTFDSRDVPTNAYKGIYLMVKDIYYPSFVGNAGGFNVTDANFRFYKELWKGSVLAFELDGQFHSGNVPWSMMSLVGNQSEMRGYYMGRYRDKNLIQSQVELRQHIYKRSGAVVWFGAGNVFPEFGKFDFSETLPTIGLGYRFRLKERTNLRLDYGFGKKGQSAFYINVNEAF